MPILSFTAIGADTSSIPSVSNDPFQLCTVLDKNLPDKLNEVRKLGKLLSEVESQDTNFCPDQCSIQELKFTGLNLMLLEDKDTLSSSALTVKLSNAQWKLLGHIRVGDRLKVLEKYFGIKINPATSPVHIDGECSRLTVWHANGRILELELDCQACI